MNESVHDRLDREAARLKVDQVDGVTRVSESFIAGVEHAANIAYRMRGEAAPAEAWEEVDPATFSIDNWLEGEEVEIIHRGTVDGWEGSSAAFSFKETGMLLHRYRGAVTVRRRISAADTKGKS